MGYSSSLVVQDVFHQQYDWVRLFQHFFRIFRLRFSSPHGTFQVQQPWLWALPSLLPPLVTFESRISRDGGKFPSSERFEYSNFSTYGEFLAFLKDFRHIFPKKKFARITTLEKKQPSQPSLLEKS